MAKTKKNELPDTAGNEFDVTSDPLLASGVPAATPTVFSLLDDEFCPRQISFTIPGKVGVQVTATETSDGSIDFVVDVIG